MTTKRSKVSAGFFTNIPWELGAAALLLLAVVIVGGGLFLME
jgi:hypothetical protein